MKTGLCSAGGAAGYEPVGGAQRNHRNRAPAPHQPRQGRRESSAPAGARLSRGPQSGGWRHRLISLVPPGLQAGCRAAHLGARGHVRALFRRDMSRRGRRRHAAALRRNHDHGGSFFGLRWQPKGGTALGDGLKNTCDAQRGSLPKQASFALECSGMLEPWLGATCRADGKRRRAAAVPSFCGSAGDPLFWQPLRKCGQKNPFSTSYDTKMGSSPHGTAARFVRK